MKKNENIAISLQVQRNKESKALFLCVQFDKAAPNFTVDNDCITWYPTNDEIDFIADAFHLIGEQKEEKKSESPELAPELKPTKSSAFSTEVQHREEKEREEKEIFEPNPDIKPMEPSIRSSEIRIPPLSDDLEINPNADAARGKGNEIDEKIFVQADDKKIDEILKRRRARIEKEMADELEEKSIMDRMLKTKKKK